VREGQAGQGLQLQQVLAAYDRAEEDAVSALPVARLAGGLINDTFTVGDRYILQRLHKVFRPEVNEDIAGLTPHLRGGGVPVPTLLPTSGGRLWVEVTTGDTAGAWRLMTRLPGRTVHRVEGPAMARAAGQAVARFHGALRGVSHRFAFTRPGAHDTDAHMAKLAEALRTHPGHRLHDAVARVADDLFSRWARWGAPPALPERIIHGDLKVSNLLFNTPGDAVCGVIDLDTMALSSLDIELGDALRSWCASASESDPSPRFLSDRFQDAMTGYLSEATPWITTPEIAAVPAAVERICLELSARFATDALNDCYFGWDPAVAPSRADHNLLRAQSQLILAQSTAQSRPQLDAWLARWINNTLQNPHNIQNPHHP
jgi:Ser/Thr protein kinase RdoA (MazF antagonist)